MGRFGDFVIHSLVGEGRGGGVVYSVIQWQPECTGVMMSIASPAAALKYPVKSTREFETMSVLSRARCLGVPKVHGSGYHNDKLWIIMDMLGQPFHESVHLPNLAANLRWDIVSRLGRLLLRRLQAIHARGFVHCDVQPDNILMGRSESSATGLQDEFVPFFVDYGLAQCFPNGPKLPNHWGTPEYSSIRTVEGGIRSPLRSRITGLGTVFFHGRRSSMVSTYSSWRL